MRGLCHVATTKGRLTHFDFTFSKRSYPVLKYREMLADGGFVCH